MAAPTKFGLSSGSPDRPFYTSTQCESFANPSLQRYSSFREGAGNPLSATLPNKATAGTTVMIGEVANFIQNLHFDLKSVSVDNKCQRLICSVFGVQPVDFPSASVSGKILPSLSWEEVKRIKASVREGSIRARERLKVFHDLVSAFNKYLPNTNSRKRSRSEVLSTERSRSSSPCDRTLLGPNVGKGVAQETTASNVHEYEQQKLEERTKNAVPYKRSRTSLSDIRMDMRNDSRVKPLESTERNRETSRPATNGAVPGDMVSSVSVVGWEKAKNKKKRSAIKVDGSLSTVSTKTNDGCQETKQGLLQRPVSDVRSRLHDSQSFRQGTSNGTVKGNTSQQSGITVGSSIPNPDRDNGSLDRKDRHVGTNKERMNIIGVNRSGSCDGFSSASPTSSVKLNALARAPRSASVSVPRSTPVTNHVAMPNDWEFSHCSNKLPLPSGTNSKHTSSTRPSSPPAHWTGQRSQKGCRPARKPSFLSIPPSNDEVPRLETMSGVAGNANVSGFGRHTLGESPRQIRLKGYHFSSTPLSESDDSANAEFKFIDSEDQDAKPANHVKKNSSLAPPGRKNKVVNDVESGDILRRQGRTAQGLASTRSVMPRNIDMLPSVRTAKQLRTAKFGLDKSERKAGRSPSRKLSGRKAYTRQKHSALNLATDISVGSVDCNEELEAAARAIMNPCHALSSAFWKEMETYFRSISDNDIAFLMHQEHQGSFLLSPSAVNLDYHAIPNGCKHSRSIGYKNEIKPGADYSMTNGITLCQRLLAALIPEEETEALDSDSDLIYDNGLEMDGGFGSNTLNQLFLESFQLDACAAIDGQRQPSWSPLDSPSPRHYMAPMSRETFSGYGHSENGILKNNETMPNLESAVMMHDDMNLDRKIRFEIETAGLFPEGLLDSTPPEDDEILADINCLVDKYHRQVVKKDTSISNLLKLSTNAKENDKRDFEARALNQLVDMSYREYMASRSLKSSANSKIIKQAAIAFVKRTLARCHTFEDTGKSCFSEPSFINKFLSTPSLNETHSADAATEGESARTYDTIFNGALEARASASIASQQSPSLTSRSGQNLDIIDIYSSDIPRSLNLPDLTNSKDDAISNSRVKKRELSLDEVGRSGIGNMLSSSLKGKRSERDREGKSSGISKHGTARTGRLSMPNLKGERKLKAKPKQRMTQLSSSVNNRLGKLPEEPSISMSDTGGMTNDKNNFAFDGLDETEPPLDLSGLQLPGLDVLGVSDDLDGQGQDIESWLNIVEDDGLHDLDFMGLEIPMDDLSDLNMMV